MKRKLVIGLAFILIGIALIINSLSGITGYVIVGEIDSTFSSILGIILLIGGLLLFVLEKRWVVGGLEKRTLKSKERLQQIYHSGRIGSYEELRRISSRMGYVTKEGKYWTHICKESEIIAKIPRHKRVATGTYRGIVKNLLQYAS